MHVVLISVGTDGDIFPYIGLGAALRARGHSITLAASEHYGALAETQGFAFHALVSTEENRELFEHPDFWKPLKTAPLMARWGVRFLRRQYDLLSKLATRETVFGSSSANIPNPNSDTFASGNIRDCGHSRFQIASGEVSPYFWNNLINPLQNHAPAHTVFNPFLRLFRNGTRVVDFRRQSDWSDQCRAGIEHNAGIHKLDDRAGSSKHDGAVGDHETPAGPQRQP